MGIGKGGPSTVNDGVAWFHVWGGRTFDPTKPPNVPGTAAENDATFGNHLSHPLLTDLPTIDAGIAI
jgi:hypothetical protein